MTFVLMGQALEASAFIKTGMTYFDEMGLGYLAAIEQAIRAYGLTVSLKRVMGVPSGAPCCYKMYSPTSTPVWR